MRLVGLGAGGHARVVMEAISLAGTHEVVGLLDPDPARRGTDVAGVPVLGDDGLLGHLGRWRVEALFCAIGSVRDTTVRRSAHERAASFGLPFVSVVHSQAVVSPTAHVGDGAAILAAAVVGAGAKLGLNVIVNTGAIVDHDCEVGSHAHIATGARLGGAVRVGEGAHVGIGASVLQGLSIGARATIGAGAVVIHNVDDDATVVGVPARVLIKRA